LEPAQRRVIPAALADRHSRWGTGLLPVLVRV